MAMVNTARMKIAPEQLAGAIRQILDEYGDEATAAVIVAGKKTTRMARKAVQASAKSQGWRKYPGSWASKFTESRLGFEGVIYSKTPGLPHLLEHGHEITYLGGVKSKGPGHARAFTHLQQVDEQVPDLLEGEIRKELNRL